MFDSKISKEIQKETSKKIDYNKSFSDNALDSLDLITIISIFEDHFKISIKEKELKKLENFIQLEKLIQKKIVSKITIRDGTTYFEFAQSQHHHHFICIQCDAVFCLPTCHVELHQINLNSFLPNPKFKIKSHDFNLYGICAPCAE